MAFDFPHLRLRDYQQDAIDRLRASLAGGRRRPMLGAPTGAGKTVIGAAVVAGARSKGKRVVFAVPAVELIDQTVERFMALGVEDIGVIQADHWMTDRSKPVQIASVQTLARRELPPADVVVVDEAHQRFRVISRWMAEAPRTPFIGLSATPWSRGLGRDYDDLITVATTQQLIDMGHLSPFRAFAPDHPDLTGVRTVAGDYHEGELSAAMSDDKLTGNVVANWLAHGEGRPTLCFAVDRAHAATLQARFEAAGVAAGYVDAYTPKDDRREIARRFHNGSLQVVCNVGCLTTGVDWDVRCVILARPTKSEMLYVQMVGRGLRTADGKADCLIRGTRVLTDKGEVNIEHVTLDHKVWDGVNFVRHQGVICKGVRPVISHDGVTATPDHRVMTNEGWKTLADAARGRLRIARTGVAGKPIRFVEGDLAARRRERAQSLGRGRVPGLRQPAHGALSQHEEASRAFGLSDLQAAMPGHSAAMALSPLSGAEGPVLQSAVTFLRTLRCAWNRVQVQKSERRGALGGGEFGGCGSIYGVGSEGQRRALRAGQSSLGEAGRKPEQYSEDEGGEASALCGVSERIPGGQIRGCDASSLDRSGDDGSANCGPLEYPVVQAEGEVWDILNAGPLQRFTANGRLVHNCLVFDHADNHARMGFVTDIHRDRLCDGKPKPKQDRERKAPEAKDCPECGYLRPPKVSTCPACGHKGRMRSALDEAEGELVELGAPDRKRQQASMADKRRFYGELLGIAREKGRKPGWAAHKYRERFGVWPRGMDDVPAEPSAETRAWVKSRDIAWAHAQKRRAA